MALPKVDQYSYFEGQWTVCERLMNKINSFVGPLRRTDMYRMLMEYKPS